MFGPERHENLADALPVPPDGAVVDLGCGRGLTLQAIQNRLGGEARLVGVDEKPGVMLGDGIEYVAADLNQRLPFDDAVFDAAVCQNVIECLLDQRAFIAEVARILRPGGHLLLGHSDFDTIVFSSSDLALTRRLVHHFCDSVQPWMTVADGTVGRRLVAVGRHPSLQLIGTFAWVGHHITLEPGGPAHLAATLVAADGRRDPELSAHVDRWLADLEQQAQAGEFLYSINDYAVLLQKPRARRRQPHRRDAPHSPAAV